MPNPTTEASLSAILAETLEIDAYRITTDESLFTDLGADSLALVEAVMAVEEVVGIEVCDDDIERAWIAAEILALIPAEARTPEAV